MIGNHASEPLEADAVHCATGANVMVTQASVERAAELIPVLRSSLQRVRW
jgi:hypothetical protein